jgi:hypothetical protein
LIFGKAEPWQTASLRQRRNVCPLLSKHFDFAVIKTHLSLDDSAEFAALFVFAAQQDRSYVRRAYRALPDAAYEETARDIRTATHLQAGARPGL